MTPQRMSATGTVVNKEWQSSRSQRRSRSSRIIADQYARGVRLIRPFSCNHLSGLSKWASIFEHCSIHSSWFTASKEQVLRLGWKGLYKLMYYSLYTLLVLVCIVKLCLRKDFCFNFWALSGMCYKCVKSDIGWRWLPHDTMFLSMCS